ncbi:MAG: acetamidase [Anaerolineae bacterium]|nr:acetamidase [Anaerolineae bacterium]
MQKQTREVLYYTHTRHNRPTLTVEPGESFIVETELCSGDWLRDITDTYHPSKGRGPNPSSGCVYVKGAGPGTMLAVTIESIVPDELGYTGFGPGANPFPDWIRQEEWGVVTKTVRIRNGCVEWSEDLKLPTQPMIGVLGTAPAREEFLNSRNGPYGGNLDAQEIATGATVYLPVYVDGALLHVGDVHAIQGDGEICCGGGIECRSTVQLRVDVLPRPERMTWARFADATHIGVFGCARPAEDAFRLATQDLIYWLADDYALDEPEVLLLLGQILEARCTQFVDPLYTYVAKVARRWLPGPPRFLVPG